MDTNSVETFLAIKGEYFPKNKVESVKEMLLKTDEQTFAKITNAEFISPEKVIIVSRLFGLFGVDRFMMGHIFLGLLKLFTLGGILIWWILDWFFVIEIVKNDNYEKLLSIIY